MELGGDSKLKKKGIRPPVHKRRVTAREALVTEEGIATLNTLLSSKVKLLWGPALAYWTR